ncbi:MAG: ATP-binding cassette domain-containing protein [Clostridiaceae bacterium]|jgi:sodium transport system ATP-binding protein|nr:ATP-binding cassette domain-containing protein [Clostridiaceae bacterium]
MVVAAGLEKKFGQFTAVDKISFKVNKGEIFGLLGENGAGKTTTLRMLSTMLKPTSGNAVLNGFDTQNEPEKVRANIGILFGGETGLYDRLTAAENIAYFGELNGMSKAAIRERSQHLAEAFGMQDFMDKRASKLSKGMKQKAAFARSIVHNPEIMLFDEPTSGLDVTASRDVQDFILDCKAEGKTIIFSSHSMSEVEKLCDRIGIIHKGKLVECGSVEELKKKYGNDDLEEIFVRLAGVR